MDSHDSTKHYVNGPEAFLHTLLAEFKDAEKRFEDIYNKITKLITPSVRWFLETQLHKLTSTARVYVQWRPSRQAPLRG